MTTNNKLNLSQNKINLIIVASLGIYPLVGMGIDLIAPSLPAITRDLQTTNIFSKNLITLFLLGYALGNFFVGFLSDTIGRRKISLTGSAVFVIVSVLPAQLPHPFLILLSRFLQGFSVAAMAIAARASLADILLPAQLIRVSTMIATMWGIGPIVGPIIGGYLQFYFNWQACFYFYALFGFISLLSFYFFVPETHLNRQPMSFTQIKNNFITIVTHRAFLGLVMLMGLSYSLLIVFNTLGPFLIQTELGYSSVYFGHLAFCMGLIFLLGTFICRRLLHYYQPEKILLFATTFFTLAAITSVLVVYLDPNNIWVIVVPALLMFLGCGIIYPTAMGKASALFRHLAGSGSAVMNLINILITTLISLIMSLVNASNAIPMTWIYLGLMLLGTVCYWCLIRIQSENPVE